MSLREIREGLHEKKQKEEGIFTRNSRLFLLAEFELLKASPNFCHPSHSFKKFQRMDRQEFMAYHFNENELAKLRTLFCANLRSILPTEHPSELPTVSEVMQWVKTPNHCDRFPLYLKWFLLKLAVDAGNEEAKTLLKEHLHEHSRGMRK
jgi:hypothetical protein